VPGYLFIVPLPLKFENTSKMTYGLLKAEDSEGMTSREDLLQYLFAVALLEIALPPKRASSDSRKKL